MTGCRDWPHTQKRASWKGVPFEVRGDVREGGRRIKTHEYPSREHWDNEDLGRLRETYSVDGYVTGDDADRQAERLRAALSSPGPGTLVLPLRPSVQARCLIFHIAFDEDEQGRFPFDAEFVLEAPGVGGVVSGVMLAGAVARAVGHAVGEVKDLFQARFDSAAAPAVARDAAARTIALAAGALEAARTAVVVGRPHNSRAAFLIRRMAGQSLSMAYNGNRPDRLDTEVYVSEQTFRRSAFGDAFAETLEHLSEGAADQEALAEALAGLAQFQPQAIENASNARSVRAERQMTREVAAYVRRASLAHLARAATKVAHASRGEAAAARAWLAEAFERELKAIDEEAPHQALVDCRNAAVSFLSRAGAELPATVTVSLPKQLPAMVAAYMFYGDATRDAELVARNRVTHPLHMPVAFEALKV